MKITLDLADFENVLNLGVKALFKESANITDVVTPFGTFHINNISPKRQELLDSVIKFPHNNIIEPIKLVRLNIGCGLKEAKNFCEKLRDDKAFRESWLKGDDEFIKRTWGAMSQDSYAIWLSR
jgi:ribosomal protein L7/L12